MISPRRLLPVLSVVVVAALSAACACTNGKCIKDPPCGPCEKACCPTPAALSVAPMPVAPMPAAPMPVAPMPVEPMIIEVPAQPPAPPVGPTVYSYNERTYILFTEKGLAEFHKDPEAFDEKAIRTMKGGVSYRTDIHAGDVDLAAYAAGAQPYTHIK